MGDWLTRDSSDIHNVQMTLFIDVKTMYVNLMGDWLTQYPSNIDNVQMTLIYRRQNDVCRLDGRLVNSAFI